jgi:hypothetical protein
LKSPNTQIAIGGLLHGTFGSVEAERPLRRALEPVEASQPPLDPRVSGPQEREPARPPGRHEVEGVESRGGAHVA